MYFLLSIPIYLSPSKPRSLRIAPNSTLHSITVRPSRVIQQFPQKSPITFANNSQLRRAIRASICRWQCRRQIGASFVLSCRGRENGKKIASPSNRPCGRRRAITSRPMFTYLPPTEHSVLGASHARRLCFRTHPKTAESTDRVKRPQNYRHSISDRHQRDQPATKGRIMHGGSFSWKGQVISVACGSGSLRPIKPRRSNQWRIPLD